VSRSEPFQQENAIAALKNTTADYGADAYEFAKGKPLVLLNGANLLHLLEKHGHKARIGPEISEVGFSWRRAVDVMSNHRGV